MNYYLLSDGISMSYVFSNSNRAEGGGAAATTTTTTTNNLFQFFIYLMNSATKGAIIESA
jgi:hypothetical protein